MRRFCWSMVQSAKQNMAAMWRSLMSRIATFEPQLQFARSIYKDVDVPKPGGGRSFRRIVHFPDEYTVKPLQITNLAGRDPDTGRVVAQGIGGGIKRRMRWVRWVRDGPTEGPPVTERVIQILDDGCRTAHLAMVAHGETLKYIVATENMKPGDLLRTSRHIPRIAVRASEGDAHPLGALPVGSVLHCVEKFPGGGGFIAHAAGASATLSARTADRVIVTMPSKRQVALSPLCMATVGRVGNVMHGSTPIGSAQRMRELGGRPRSGLWHRKDGRHGRKIKPLPRVKDLGVPKPPPPPPAMRLHLA